MPNASFRSLRAPGSVAQRAALLPWLLVCLLFTATPASLRAQAPGLDGAEDPIRTSHRHVLTKGFRIPDWVTDPNLRKLFEEHLKSLDAKTGQAPTQDPEELEKLFGPLQDLLKKLPPGTKFPDVDELKKDNPELFKSLLDANRDLLQPPSGTSDPDLESFLNESLRTLTKKLQDSKIDRSLFKSLPKKNPPLLSPKGTELMKRWLGKIKVGPDLKKTLERGMNSMEGVLKSWFERAGVGGEEDDPAAKPPDAAGQDPAAAADPTAAAGGGSGGGALQSLPSFARFSFWALLRAVLWAALAALAAFCVWLAIAALSKRLAPVLRRLLPRRPPRLPERFDGPEEFFRAYAAVMAWVTGGPIEGRTHRELEAQASAGAPALAGAASAAADAYERLYYDRRALPESPQLCGRAHEACRSLLTTTTEPRRA